MSIPSIVDHNNLPVLEKHLERQALAVLHGPTFTACLKLNGLAPAIEVTTSTGKILIVRGSDIYDRRTWQKFLKQAHQETAIYQLTEVGENLTKRYKAWLLKEHTKRYHSLASEAELLWLDRVVTLAVVRHIMEQKYHAYIKQGLETFADQWAAVEMGNILMLNSITREAAQLVHHIVKQPEQAQQLIEMFYEELRRQMEARPHLLREPLPPLPDNMSLPLAFLTQTIGEPDERSNDVV